MSDPSSPADLVRSFCDAWSTLDVEVLGAYFAEDAVYHNIPIDPVKGVGDIKAFIASFAAGASAIEFQVAHLIADGPVVVTERVDVFTYPHTRIELPVMGIFEVRDAKISAWRDYFDMNQFMSQLQGS
jgi:limonene-1,2-epoxide hydrolase